MGATQELTLLVTLVILTFTVEATGRERIIIADQKTKKRSIWLSFIDLDPRIVDEIRFRFKK